MVDSYNTILTPGIDEIVEKKSRFIGYAQPVSSEEEAYAFVESVKKKHYDARHNCHAFAIGKENTLYRFSDDGEPQGTAGKPILEVISGNQVTDICIVVTRYFGGTLLGTGGLVRAYTEAAKLALADAGLFPDWLVGEYCVEGYFLTYRSRWHLVIRRYLFPIRACLLVVRHGHIVLIYGAGIGGLYTPKALPYTLYS